MGGGRLVQRKSLGHHHLDLAGVDQLADPPQVVGVGFGASVHIPAFQSEGVEVVAVVARIEHRDAAVNSREPDHATCDGIRFAECGFERRKIAVEPSLELFFSQLAANIGRNKIDHLKITLGSETLVLVLVLRARARASRRS